MTIKVTGYPWRRWRYDYLGEDVSFSDLSMACEQIENKVPKGRTTFSGSEARCSS